MSLQIINEFSLGTNFRDVAWRDTILYNSMRAFGAGIIVGIFNAFHGQVLQMLLAPFMIVLFYLFAVVPITLVVSTLHKTFPWLGLINIFLGFLTVAIGDWFVCVISSFSKNIVPIKEPAIFCLAPVIVLMYGDEHTITGNYFK